MKQVTVLAPAKLNLALDVVGLLPNGYHDLDMVMQTITLYERLTLRRAEEVQLRLPGSWVPVNEKNTAVKAARAFFRYTGLAGGVDMEIEKHIPVRAGMAGGSADAAGVLVGLNALYEARRVQGVGDFLKALPPCPPCWFVIAMPSVGVSTPEAFARYDQMGSPLHPDLAVQEAAIRAGDLAALCAAAGNALEHCSGAKETPHIRAILDEQGALASLMTGSGAAVFGVFDREAKAQAARAALRQQYKQVYLAQPDRGGPRLVFGPRKPFGRRPGSLGKGGRNPR